MEKITQNNIVPKNLSVNSSQGKTRIQWLIAFLVNITVLSYGLNTGWIACMARVLQSEESPIGYPLSATDISWLASSPSLAATLSIPAWTVLVDKFGRRPCIISGAVLQTSTWIIIYFATNMTALMVGRVVGGIAGAGCVYFTPMYIKEISQDDIRGTLGMIMNNSRNIGVLVVYIMGGYLSYYSLLWIVAGISTVGVLATLKAPESPTYYVKIGKIDTAAATIAYLRNLSVEDRVVQNAMDSIKAEDEKFKSLPSVSIFGLFKVKAWRKGFIFMFLLFVWSGLNGGFMIVNYAPLVLEMFKITVDLELISLSVPIFMIIGSLMSMVLIERLGRKPLLSISFFLAMVSFAAMAAIYLIQEQGGYVPSWVSIACIVMPVFTYAAAISPIPFLIMPEMFNFQIRAKVVGCLGMLGWSGAFIQVLAFIPMSNTFGPHVTFIVFSIINLLGTLVVLVLLPETKGKSIQQIELELEKKLEGK